MAKILITGGFGYIGGRLSQFLATQPEDETLLGTRQLFTPPSWLPQAKVVQIHWSSPDSLEKICGGVDTIVHLAGMNAQDCAASPVHALEFNAVATGRLLQAAIQQGVKRFLYISTAHVYGSPLKGVLTEETCPTNLHPYATSHRAGEDIVRHANHCRQIEGVVVRLSNAYGAPTHKEANCWMLLVNDLCRQAVTNQRMILQSTGLQRRDFIPLTDVCRAIKYLIELSTDRLDNGLFNLGGCWSPTILEMAQLVADRIHGMTGLKPEILRKIDSNIQPSELLDYQIKKLIGTGFSLNDKHTVNQEIDGLVNFCLCNH